MRRSAAQLRACSRFLLLVSGGRHLPGSRPPDTFSLGAPAALCQRAVSASRQTRQSRPVSRHLQGLLRKSLAMSHAWRTRAGPRAHAGGFACCLGRLRSCHGPMRRLGWPGQPTVSSTARRSGSRWRTALVCPLGRLVVGAERWCALRQDRAMVPGIKQRGAMHAPMRRTGPPCCAAIMRCQRNERLRQKRRPDDFSNPV